MNRLTDQIVEEVFPEERRRLVVWLNEQKRHLRSWTVLIIILLLIPVILRLPLVVGYIVFHSRLILDLLYFAWLLTVVCIPFIWPQKPGDVFIGHFKSGINPAVWEFEGDWRAELDEYKSTVLSVTASDPGGLALPCLSWTDYELLFDTRIINKVTAWTVRASSLNECVMFQLGPKILLPHYRVSGVWIPLSEIEHGLPIRQHEWFSVRTLIRGPWATIYVSIDGKLHPLFQQRILGTQPPITISINQPPHQIPSAPSRQIVSPTYRSGSFGFRLSSDEHAQFKNLKTYRLK